MSDPKQDALAEQERKLAEARAYNDARGIKDVPFDEGPAAAARQFGVNVLGGDGRQGAGQALLDAAPPVRDFIQGTGGPKPAAVGPEPADLGLPGDPGNQTARDFGEGVSQKTMNFERPFESPQAAEFFRKEGYSKAPVGGAALYDEAFIHAPKRREQAEGELAGLRGDQSKALSDFYSKQSESEITTAAAAKQSAQEDQVNLKARQQRLDEAANYYTNDLADQGKFWQNPGNIVSAIAFSLMPIFSNDPTIGVKLINQAIDRDMANRQHAANQTLGALQSNLSGYQKIAGDRQAGDLLARAEAHRIAAQQIQQISMSYESPIAKKQAQVAIEDQKVRQAAAQMDFYKANIHVDAKKMDPRLDAASVQGGPNGYNSGIAPLGGIPAPQSAGGPQPTAVMGELGKTGLATTAGNGKMAPTTAALLNTGGLAGVNKGVSKGVVHGDQLEEATRSFIYKQAISMHKDPNVHFHDEIGKANQELATAAPLIAKNASSGAIISSLQTRMKVIEDLEASGRRDPNDFVGYARKVGLPDYLIKQYDQITGGDPRNAKNKAEELAKWKADSIRGLEQHMAMAINQNIHDLSGGAVNVSEQGRLDKEISPSMPWQQQKSFVDMKSKALQAYVDAQARGIANPVAQALYRINSTGGKLNDLERPGRPGPATPPGYGKGPVVPYGPQG